METFDGSDFRVWRKAVGMTVEYLAAQANVSIETIYNIQNGSCRPDPDLMFRLCRILGDESKWFAWMATEYPKSYGRMHPIPNTYSLEGAIMTLFSEVRDLKELERQAMKDGADGRIDSDTLKQELLKEVTEMIQAAQRAKTLLERR